LSLRRQGTAGQGPEESGSAAMNDRELMRGVQSGDETALGVLMERWELPIKRFIARIVFNASEAEELAQETFVRVWTQREKFRPEAEFRPWIFSIAVNLARNRLRWWRSRPNVSLEDWFESSSGIDRSGGSVTLERAERAVAVRDAVAALSHELREALVLFHYEELSQAEIAVALGCSVKTVETRVARAREKLRISLRALE
jgi:RNA polymerase sigma-70 factor, ECF subfamily